MSLILIIRFLGFRVVLALFLVLDEVVEIEEAALAIAALEFVCGGQRQ